MYDFEKDVLSQNFESYTAMVFTKLREKYGVVVDDSDDEKETTEDKSRLLKRQWLNRGRIVKSWLLKNYHFGMNIQIGVSRSDSSKDCKRKPVVNLIIMYYSFAEYIKNNLIHRWCINVIVEILTLLVEITWYNKGCVVQFLLVEITQLLVMGGNIGRPVGAKAAKVNMDVFGKGLKEQKNLSSVLQEMLSTQQEDASLQNNTTKLPKPPEDWQWSKSLQCIPKRMSKYSW